MIRQGNEMSSLKVKQTMRPEVPDESPHFPLLDIYLLPDWKRPKPLAE